MPPNLSRRSFASYLMAMAPAIIAYVITRRWVIAGVTPDSIT
jgi:raffinose/stachyose/melibiose transport system permease protein